MRKLFIALVASALFMTGVMPAYAAPLAPESVTAVSNSAPNTAINLASVKVTWRGHASTPAYSVSATDSALNSFSSAATCDNQYSCVSILAGLSGGIEYSIKVTAIALDGTTTPAPIVKATAVSVPPAPLAVSATSISGKATLTWEPNLNNGGSPITGYKITEKDNKISEIVVGAGKTTQIIESVVVGQSYVFSVSTTNANGTSARDDFRSLTVTGSPIAPAAPLATITGSTLSVSWVAPADQGAPITGYKVYVVDASTNSDVGSPVSIQAPLTTASIPNLSSGLYKVQIIATNSNGDSQRSPMSSPFQVGTGTRANTPVFTPNALLAMDIGSSQPLSVVVPSGGDVTITVSSSPSGACTFGAGRITAVSPGTCTVTATAEGNSTFAAGTGSRTVTVKAQQAIVFAEIDQQTMPGPFTLSAVATSGLSVRYAASGACTVVGRVISFTNAGVCSVVASQPGNVSFSAANPITRSFAIVAAPAGGSGGGSSSGGSNSGGGGGGSTPNPIESSAPIVKPTPTPSPTSSPVPTKTPSPTPTVAAPKLSDSASLSKSLTGSTVRSIPGTKVTTALKLGRSIAARVSPISSGTKVVTTLKNAKGQVFTLPTVIVGKSRIYSSYAIKPKVRGTYTVTVAYGKVKKTLIIIVK